MGVKTFYSRRGPGRRLRDELLSDDGPLARFAKDEARAILRPSQAYAVLLNHSYHPDALRDALDRGRLLDRLRAIVPGRPEMAKVIPAEQSDLRQETFRKFLGALEERMDVVTNYFISRSSSGRVEGLNNKIKALKRCSYGIKNLASLFRRIWLDLRGHETFAH